MVCTRCKKEVEIPEWDCVDGMRHQVEAKTYYSPAANLTTYSAEERIVHINGNATRIPAKRVQFLKGAFTTCDPQDQFGLDNQKGLITADQWKEIFVSKEERVAMKERELDVRERRIIEQQSALDRLKAQSKGVAKEGTAA